MMYKSNRGTYFYNIEKMDTNVVDEYKIYYENSSDTKYLLMIYEEYLLKYLNENNIQNYNFISSDSNEHILFESEEIKFSVTIINIDENNLHVKVFLNNLSNSLYNKYILDFSKIIKETKIQIIEHNKLLNLLSFPNV